MNAYQKQLVIVCAGVGAIVLLGGLIDYFMGWPVGSETSKIWRIVMLVVTFGSVPPLDLVAKRMTKKEGQK